MSLENRLFRGPRYTKEKDLIVPKAVLTDVDGTILSSQSNDLPSARVTSAFHEAGSLIPTGLITARPPQTSLYLADHLRLSGPSIFSNGAQIGREGLMIIERPLPVLTTKALAKELQTLNVDHWIQDDGVDFRWNQHETSSAGENLGSYRYPIDMTDLKKGQKMVDDYNPTKPFVILAHRVTQETAQTIISMTEAYADQQVAASIGHEEVLLDGTVVFDVFITDSRANKHRAMQEVSEMTRTPLEAFLVVGDGSNDAVAVEHAGVGVAMRNGVDKTKAVAVYIAPDLKHDGAAVAVEDLILSKQLS